MAKPWSEVENSEVYQSLNPEEQNSAKQEYWNTVVVSKDTYKSLAPQEKQLAQQEFLGVATPKTQPVQTPQNAFQAYLREAQPAFKLAIAHPETLMGKTLTPEEVERSTNLPWSDIYREAGGGILPFAKSQSMVGQLVPEVAGNLLDIGTRPSSYVASYIMPKALKASALFPPTRRWLQIHTPTLSKWLIEANPMQPQYKEIRGMQVDITKPLPKESGWLVKQGEKLVNIVRGTIDDARNQYSNLLKSDIHASGVPSYQVPIPKEQLANLPKGLMGELGLTKETATNGNLWEGRWELLKKLNESTFTKEELLKRTKLSEDEILNGLQRLKAIVMNNVSKETRQSIEILDPKFTEIMKSGKGIIRSVLEGITGKIKTTRLVNIFKNVDDDGTRDLFNRFAYFDKRINEVSRAVRGYVFRQGVKSLGKKVISGGLILGTAYGLGRKMGSKLSGQE